MKNLNQSIAIALAILLIPVLGYSQGDKANRPSPPDKVSKTIGNATVTINYSQPAVKGRKIFGELVPYDKVWRTGANEATTFEVDEDVKIGDKTLKAGKYSLFTIPGKEEWTIIFNSATGQWGTQYDQDKDVVRINAKAKKSSQMTERMKFDIKDDGKVKLLWENTQVGFQITPVESASSEM